MIKSRPNTDLEEKYWDKSGSRELLVAGVDEAGRGALAGPVVAAAVILPPFCTLEAVNDSKQLSAKKRAELLPIIIEMCISYGVGMNDARHIETFNILQSSVHAMQTAIDELRPQPAHLLIDGNYFRSEKIPFTTVVEGDARSLSIAAASIIAKVSRDRWMTEVADALYPQFGFAKHKGYGTKEHVAALRKYGASPLHRQTFLTKIFNGQTELFG